jgi:hypothetical protein
MIGSVSHIFYTVGSKFCFHLRNSIYMEHKFVDVKNVMEGPHNDDWASGGVRFSHEPWDFVDVPARVTDAGVQMSKDPDE